MLPSVFPVLLNSFRVVITYLCNVIVNKINIWHMQVNKTEEIWHEFFE